MLCKCVPAVSWLHCVHRAGPSPPPSAVTCSTNDLNFAGTDIGKQIHISVRFFHGLSSQGFNLCVPKLLQVDKISVT